jgi:hypothetical protein
LSASLLVSRLSFTHFRLLLEIGDPLKGAFYEVESIKGNWAVRELKRQIGSLYFERSGLSRNKARLFAARRAIYHAELLKEGAEPEAIAGLSIPPAFHDVLLISACIGFAVVILSLFRGKGKSVTAPPDIMEESLRPAQKP